MVVGQSPPTASITVPATYNAGDTVSFSGTATDPVDGTLPGYDYTWQVDFVSNGVVQPSYTDEVGHPVYGPVTGSTSGSFQIPTDATQTPSSFYRITLTVTDSLGLQTVVTKDIHPNVTNWSVDSNVPGVGYSVDGTWHTGSFSTQDVVGVQHVLTGMPLAQVIGGTRYRFAGWADGSALTDSFTAGSSPASFTANYDAVQTDHAVVLAEHRCRQPDHRGDGRLRVGRPELLRRRLGRRCVRRQRSVPLRVPDPDRRRDASSPGSATRPNPRPGPRPAS